MKRQEIGNYEEAVEYLLSIPRFTKKNTMEDTKAFLKRLGNPDQSFRIIHVAGTNGKGSVCAYMRRILEEAGYSVCVFTSPHLVDIRERFLIKGEIVTKAAFLKAFGQIYDMIPWDILSGEDVFNESGKLPEGFYHPTFFEYLFFMACLLFRDAKPDYVILETGLGGRLDATNSVSHKELAVITRISLDHMEYLGDTPEKIASEKAGIMAKGTPVIYTDTSDAVCAVFDEWAEKIGASSWTKSKNDYALLNFRDKIIDFSLHTRYYNDIRLSLHTAALYQMENAALAVRALEMMDQGHTIKREHLQRGVEKTFWPGRMEELWPDVFVDGAHNEDGVRAFLESVSADGWQGRRVLLFSAVKDKQFEKMLNSIVESELFAELYLVPLQTGRATELAVLEKTARQIGAAHRDRVEREKSDLHDSDQVNLNHGRQDLWIGSYFSAREAVKELLEKKTEDQRIYIAGSLYLVGEVLASRS